MSVKRRTDLKIAVDHSTPINPRVTREEIELLREKTLQLVINNPQKAATILASWLQASNSANTKKQDKKAA